MANSEQRRVRVRWTGPPHQIAQTLVVESHSEADPSPLALATESFDVEAGADPKQLDARGRTALDLALGVCRHDRAARLLTDYGGKRACEL